jgi:GntR family transcriptional repressor for pyruvate dehydrogenase complex
MSVKKKKTFEYVIDMIKKMLINGEIEEGKKLPNQIEFAKQLGVSRLSLREALCTLENIGVVLQKPKLGTVIINGDTSKWVKQATPPLLTDRKATFELIEARKVIEAAIAKSAARNIEDDEVNRLEKILIDMKVAQMNGKSHEYSDLDMEFHLLIAKATKNRYLLNMFMTVITLMKKMIDEVNGTMPIIMKNSSNTHRKIFEALKKRDGKEAMKWQVTHINRVCEYYNKYYHGV